MKEKQIILFTGLLLSSTCLFAQGGLFTSFKLGIPFSSTSIGLQIGSLAVYGGVGIIRISADYDYESTSYEAEWDSGYLYKYRERTENLKGSAQLIMPHIGVRLNMGGEAVKLYLNGNIQITIPSVEGRSEYRSVYYNPDGTIWDIDEDEYELSEEDQEKVQDVLDFVSVSLGFGTEYYFSNGFSIGGEFGLRLFRTSFEFEEVDEDIYEGTVDWREEWKATAEASLGTTYTQFTLNYYF